MGDNNETYKISFTSESELGDLQDFIHRYWKADHVLARNKKLMDWQHYNPTDRRYNYVIARHAPTNEIHGILGFIATSHFDPALKSNDVWTQTWKVREDVKAPGLGIALMNFLSDQLKPRSLGAVGLSRMAVQIYDLLRYETGTLSHYFLLNRSIEKYALARNVTVAPELIGHDDPTKRIIRHQKDQFLDSIGGVLKTEFAESLPAKSPLYLYNRYLDHPAYEYHAYSIVAGNDTVALFITRPVEHGNSVALRVVDIIGSPNRFSGLGSEFQRLLETRTAEYIDFYGIIKEEQALATSGFVKRRENDTVIIPNYFEPFEPRNIQIAYAVQTECENYRFYKGDSDQDRPNMMGED